MERQQAFGQAVKALRKKRGLSQQDLARNILGITPRTLGKIERGEKAFVSHEIVSGLANYFNLEGLAREEFFNQAGLNETTPAEDYARLQSESATVHTFFSSIDFPAYAHDAFYNMYCINSSLLAIFGINVEDYTREFFHPSGPHLLRILFEVQLEAKTTWAKDRAWRAHAEMLVYRFRQHSKKYIGTTQYIELLDDLKKNPEFKEVWRKVESPNYMPHFPTLSVFYLRNGQELKFISTIATDTAFVTTEANKIMFVPANDATRQYLAHANSGTPYFYLMFDRSQPRGYIQVTPQRS